MTKQNVLSLFGTMFGTIDKTNDLLFIIYYDIIITVNNNGYLGFHVAHGEINKNACFIT